MASPRNARLDRLATPLLRRAVHETAAVIASAGLRADQLAGLFLVGGSSRLPLAAKVWCTLFLVGIGCGCIAALTQAATTVGVSAGEVRARLGQEPSMTHIGMHEHSAEREIRPITVGRNNWTFAGSDQGGHRAAAIYTLIQSARLNDVDPHAWLADVLARLQDHPAKRIDELLPWNWKRERPQKAAA